MKSSSKLAAGHSMADRSSILRTMAADLDTMFERMDSKQRKQDLDRHSALVQFGVDMAGWQGELLDRQMARKTEPPPAVELGWAPPQTVKQANQHFHEFAGFARARDEQIDASTQELLEVNNRMVAGFERIFGSS
jgi:hypothetical protein